MEAAGFCIRTADPDLTRGLDDLIGRGWPDLLAEFGGRILHASPTRVTRSPIGRIEVFTPIPLPGGQRRTARTRTSSRPLAAGQETPPGLDSPILDPFAIFYPEAEPSDSGSAERDDVDAEALGRLHRDRCFDGFTSPSMEE